MRGHTRRRDSLLMPDRHASTFYEIRVRGVLGEMLVSAFPALHCTAHDGDTVLSGHLADQAALHGVLGLIESLSLELLSVRRIAGRSPHSCDDRSHPLRQD